MSTIVTSGLTPDEDAQLARLLRKVEAGQMSEAVFYGGIMVFVVTGIELLVMPSLDSPNRSDRVLLTRRANTDPYWPGLLHIPGSIIRTSDLAGTLIEGHRDALDRVLQEMDLTRDDVMGIREVFHQSRVPARGREEIHLYNGYLKGSAQPVGEWHNPRVVIDHPDLIPHQRSTLERFIAYTN